MDFFLPYSALTHPEVTLLALALDLKFGDPTLPWPHPVTYIGKIYNLAEPLIRRLSQFFPNTPAILERMAGVVILLSTMLLVGGIGYFLLTIPYLGYLLAIYLAWAGLAMGCLIDTGQIVFKSIEEETLSQAQNKLSWLVSRETKIMDRPLLRKTLADTLTENFTDALTAPFFYLLLFGPIGLWVYKVASTMDSMWGYLTPKWRYLGWAGARCDDLLAFIPARISIVAVHWTDFILRNFFKEKRLWHGTWPGFFKISKQAWGMPSPNSGCPMAAFAWLLKARLGGPSIYFGQNVPKPWLGVDQEIALPWDRKLLQQLFLCLEYAAIIGMFSLWAIFAVIALAIQIKISFIL
ncbi:MAG: cobalamin biosynthesis protein CobD [Desulfovibrionaceae bacterium]|nr:cobalamin biosynthesis protein CobD [Desulfovibrionaceae bacterium]